MSTTQSDLPSGERPEDDDGLHGRDRDPDSPADAAADAPTPPPDPEQAALLSSLPPRLRGVASGRARTRDDLPERGGCADDPQLSAAAQRVWDAERNVARSLAARYRALAELHEFEGEYEETCEIDEVDTLRAGLGLRVTRSSAGWQLRDAYQAVHMLPRALARLESGTMPSAWFQRMLRSARPLSDDSRRDLDLVISTWSMDISPERFFTLLRALVGHLRDRESNSSRAEPLERRVELLPTAESGMGILQISGPIPEILARWKSLDESARAVQSAQRAALRDGTPIPHDPDGVVQETGRALPLSQLRFLLIASAELDVDDVAVPVERFRLNVTVPALTLLGASDEPGMLDGVTPLPPAMARSLAASCTVWYRILTEASCGAFLPLPAERCTPTPAMLEHLRLRNGQCAVPGCTRPTSWASECDHIEEFLRGTPDAGGLTSIENLHLLCWQHHLDKTNGLLDPARIATAATEPGRTRWTVGRHGDAVTVIDDIDTASLHMAEVLTAAWASYQDGRRAGTAMEDPSPPPPPPAPPASIPPDATSSADASRHDPSDDSDPAAEPGLSDESDPDPEPSPPDGPEPPPEGWGEWGPPPF